jgi:hypothetical protein
VSSGKAIFEPRGAILRGDGNGQLATREAFRDFVLHLYIRGVAHHNGGIMFRSIPASQGGPNRSYEIQLHDVEGAHYATGSLYSIKRASYPRIEPSSGSCCSWSCRIAAAWCASTVTTVLEYEGLENVEPGRLELQAHDAGKWIEYKQVKVRRL